MKGLFSPPVSKTLFKKPGSEVPVAGCSACNADRDCVAYKGIASLSHDGCLGTVDLLGVTVSLSSHVSVPWFCTKLNVRQFYRIASRVGTIGHLGFGGFFEFMAHVERR